MNVAWRFDLESSPQASLIGLAGIISDKMDLSL